MRGQNTVLICVLFFLTLASIASSFSSECQESCPTEKGSLLRAWGCWEKEKESSQECKVIKRGAAPPNPTHPPWVPTSLALE